MSGKLCRIAYAELHLASKIRLLYTGASWATKSAEVHCTLVDLAWKGPDHMQEAPLLRQLLSSSTTEHAAERLWLVRLLAAGFRGQEEGDIFR